MSACIRTQLVSHVRSYIDNASGDRRRCSHGRTHQVRAASPALAALEIAIRRRRAALSRTQHILVHTETHRASGIAPLESCIGEDLIQPFLLGLRFDACSIPELPWRAHPRRPCGLVRSGPPRAGLRSARWCTIRETRDRREAPPAGIPGSDPCTPARVRRSAGRLLIRPHQDPGPGP